MGNPKQNIIPEDGISQGSVHEAALNAHNLAHNSGAPSADEVTSLNTLLQWGAAHSAPPSTEDTSKPAPTARSAPEDREWLSAAFPDMNAAVKLLIADLNAALPEEGGYTKSAEDIADMLEALEEYLSDINYAHNIVPLRVLPPLLRALAHPEAEVRAAAAWCAGSALQDAPKNADALAAADGLPLLAATLRDAGASVRAKGVRAASALLRAAEPAMRDTFRALDVGPMLRAALRDNDARVRSRAIFFLAHAAECGNRWFVEDVVADVQALRSVAAGVGTVGVHDVAAFEACAAAVAAVLRLDKPAVLRAAPELYARVESARAKCKDKDARALLDGLVKLLS